MKRASGVITKVNPGIYDEYINNHCVDSTADGVLIHREYHQPSSQLT